MPYTTPGALRQALEARLQIQSRERGVELDRLRRYAAFERLLVRLERAQSGRWVVKGGVALELRMPMKARTTKDLDLVLREALVEEAAIRDLLVQSLEQDPEGDWFEFRVGRGTRLGAEEAGHHGWRFSIAARLDGRVFANVRIDVATRADEIVATERLPLPGVLRFAEFPVVEVEVVERSQHFAEKLHAFTRTYGERPSTRVRDIADLMLLIEGGLEPSQRLVAAVEHVFSSRGTHSLPAELPDPPAGWAGRYSEITKELGIRASSIQEAIRVVRDFWNAALASPTK